MKLRTWDKWTKGEMGEYGEYFKNNVCTYKDLVNRALEIAQRPIPRREIAKGTIVFVADDEDKDWDKAPRWYFKRSYPRHACSCANGAVLGWTYVRPIPPGWKPGDPLAPPNEGDK